MSLLPNPSVLPGVGRDADALSPLVGHVSVLLVYVGEALLIGSLWYAQPQALDPLAAGLGVGTFVVFGLSYAVQARLEASPALQLVMAGLMSLSSVVFNLMFSRLESYTALPLQVISAMVIVGVVPGRVAVPWIVIQSLALAWANAWDVPLAFKLLLYPGYTVMQLFSAYLMKIMLRERAQRMEVSRLNGELQRAWDVVAATSQIAERHRIARDLHDTLGHRLTALSLELEFASKVTGDRVWEAVERAQEINQQLLSEVRQTVNAIRDPQELDLEQNLTRLGEQFPLLQVNVTCDSGLPLQGEVCEVLLKCAREAVTNAVRHASAPEIQVHLRRELGKASLYMENAIPRAEVQNWPEGHGLRGMRERLEAIGGQLYLRRNATSFQLEMQVPLDMSGNGEKR